MYDQAVWFDDLQVTVTRNVITAQTDYYPFGMIQAGNSMNTSDPLGNKYLYNGKELQEDLGLQWYDYGARMYDASLARFGTLDLKAEDYIFQSPYVYAANNPILFIDEFGLGPKKPPKNTTYRIYSPIQISSIKIHKDNVGEVMRIAQYSISNEFVDDEGNKSDFAERNFKDKFSNSDITFPKDGMAGEILYGKNNDITIEGLNFETGEFEILLELSVTTSREQRDQKLKEVLVFIGKTLGDEVLNRLYRLPPMINPKYWYEPLYETPKGEAINENEQNKETNNDDDENKT